MPQQLYYLSETAAPSAIPQLRLIGPARAAGLEAVDAEAATARDPHCLARLVEPAAAVLAVHRSVDRKYRLYRQLVDTARERGIPIVYDVDDLLLLLPEEHPDYHLLDQRVLGILEATLHADLVVTTVQPLKTFLDQFHPNVRVIANQLTDEVWRILSGTSARTAPRPDGSAAVPPSVVRIGYFGTYAHARDFQLVAPALRQVLQRYPHVELTCYGVAPPAELAVLPTTVFVQPSRCAGRDYTAYAREVSALMVDIGIAPLEDTHFNRCKSAIKALEYGALGIPGVYSNLDPYRDFVQHGATGWLATSTREWVEYLSLLIEDRQRAALMGAAARVMVRERGVLIAGAPAWRAAYDAAAVAARTSPRCFQQPRVGPLIDIARRAMRYQQAAVPRKRLHKQVARAMCRGWRLLPWRSRRTA